MAKTTKKIIEEIKPKNIEYTPKMIKEYLDTKMIGQEEAKKRCALEVYKHLLMRENEMYLMTSGKSITKSNIIMSGLTGTGKTYMWELLSKFLDVPIYIQDCTKLTESGYVGDDVENCIKGLLESAYGDIQRAENGIVVLDEFDKIARKSGENVSITRDVGAEGVQQGLLKIIQGTYAKVGQGRRNLPNEEGIMVNTKNILFVACGSFEGIENIVKERLKEEGKEGKPSIGFMSSKVSNKEYTIDELRSNVSREDLMKFGIMPEMLGRFSILTNFESLKKEQLVQIIKLNNNKFEDYKTMLELIGKKLIINDKLYDEIAEKALKEKTGARGLDAIIENSMFEIMFNAPSDKEKNYKLDKIA